MTSTPFVPPGPAGAPVAPGASTTDDTLQLIADSITAVAEWGVAAVSLVHGERIWVVAVSGSQAAREALLHTSLPVAHVEHELAGGQQWGSWCFVPHQQMRLDLDEVWVPDIEVRPVPDAWHPLDLLAAPLRDEDGRLVALIAIDEPQDGRRPGEEGRRLLDAYAQQAVPAVRLALQRRALVARARRTDAVREVVRQAIGRPTLASVLDACRDALVDGFGAYGLWLYPFALDGVEEGHSVLLSGAQRDFEVPDDLVALARESAGALWDEQRAVVVSGDRLPALLTEAQRDAVVELALPCGEGSLLFVPVGLGPRCLGLLALGRHGGQPDWSDDEAATAAALGHDLGAALHNVASHAREQEMMGRLRRVDRHRVEMLQTVTHELRTPLSAIMGHVELLDDAPELSSASRSSVVAVARNARRLNRLVDDLLFLGRVGDPDLPLATRPIDLGRVVRDTVDLHQAMAQQRHQTLTTQLPAAPAAIVDGDADELGLVVSNLVGNAVKYTADGGRIQVRLSRDAGRAVLTCRDDGVGIPSEELDAVFTEFYRTREASASAEAGSGLGLAIVRRVVERHGGEVSVTSRPGVGSTFRVVLPLSSADAAEATSPDHVVAGTSEPVVDEPAAGGAPLGGA